MDQLFHGILLEFQALKWIRWLPIFFLHYVVSVFIFVDMRISPLNVRDAVFRKSVFVVL